jgi:uncharacterized membrane protein YsdA (DUF1294 family)
MPYYTVSCGFSGCTNIFGIVLKRHDFRKKLFNIKCVIVFSTILSTIFVILKEIHKCYKCENVFI